MMHIKNLFVLFFLLLTSCGVLSQKPYRIGIDPSWYPLDFGRKQGDVNAYINELLQMIALEEGVTFERISANWDTLYDDLETGKYQGIISSMVPTTPKNALFSFSDPILMTGPVLVIRKDEKESSLEDLAGRTLFIVEGSSAMQILQKYPKIIIRTAISIPQVLNQVADESANGALVSFIFAKSYVNDLFSSTLKIVGSPLSNEGLRMITLKDERVLKIFSRGLKKLEGKKIEALKNKWQI